MGNRRAGEMMRDTEKNKGLKGSVVSGTTVVPVRDNTPTLADMGISKNESSRWQKLAAVSNEKFEEAVAMAAYARQAQDKELLQWATEIKVRAERRGGQMTREIESARGKWVNLA